MIAYFLLVHRFPHQFKRLFNALYTPTNTYLIHIDKKASRDLYLEISLFLETFPNAHILESQNVVWGGYSMVEVELKAIAFLLKHDLKWEFFINLSGQDFPLKSQAEIADFLGHHPETSFINVLDQVKERPNTLNRIYNYFTETADGFIGRPKRRAYLADTVPYIGGQWKILSRQCCEFLTSSPKVKKYRTFYKHSLIADEGFFQTVLMNAGFTGRIINDDKRAIIWVPDFGPVLKSSNFSANTTKALVASGEIKLRPKTLTFKDLAFLKKSGSLFARKLDEVVDSKLFTSLEKRLKPVQKVKSKTQPINPALEVPFKSFALLP